MGIVNQKSAMCVDGMSLSGQEIPDAFEGVLRRDAGRVPAQGHRTAVLRCRVPKQGNG